MTENKETSDSANVKEMRDALNKRYNQTLDTTAQEGEK
jgi:hypothetical protein